MKLSSIIKSASSKGQINLIVLIKEKNSYKGSVSFKETSLKRRVFKRIEKLNFDLDIQVLHTEKVRKDCFQYSLICEDTNVVIVSDEELKFN